jgi:hypothetical protein
MGRLVGRLLQAKEHQGSPAKHQKFGEKWGPDISFMCLERSHSYLQLDHSLQNCKKTKSSSARSFLQELCFFFFKATLLALYKLQNTNVKNPTR